VFLRIWLPPGRRKGAPPGELPALPRIGAEAITPQTVAHIVRARAMAAGFARHDLGGDSPKSGALVTGRLATPYPMDLPPLDHAQLSWRTVW
jgi:hypothetical protein